MKGGVQTFDSMLKMKEYVCVGLLVVVGFVGARTPRIRGGVEAEIGEFPGQLSLQKDGVHDCGASILNAEWSLTAAHCVSNVPKGRLRLKAGSILSDSCDGSLHDVSDVIVHPRYSLEDSWANDIALLKVNNPFPIDGSAVAPVTLARENQDVAEGTVATVIGWGAMEAGGPIAKRLQKVEVTVASQQFCHLMYDPLNYHVHDELNICAQVDDVGHGACNGDSGGPLLASGTVVGLVSWSMIGGCSTSGFPYVYTRVSAYRNWIFENSQV